jgi:hypothetical protein
MLRRYAREQLSSGFGIYVGDSTKGIVQTLAPPSSPSTGMPTAKE